MNILIAAAHLPSPVSHQAGQKTTFFVAKWFVECGHRVDLLSFATEQELERFRPHDMESFASYKIFPITRKSRILAALSHPCQPLLAASRWSAPFKSTLIELLNKRYIDYVYLDFTGMMYLSPLLGSVPAVSIMEVDVTFRTWERLREQTKNPLRKLAYGLEARRTRTWELQKLREVQIVLVQSTMEKELLGRLIPEQHVHLLQPWVELYGGRMPVAHSDREPGSLVFWGAMDRHPNVDAVRYATKEILPLLSEWRIRFRYHVVGSLPPEEIWQLADGERVVVSGFVEDPFAVLSQKRIALLPMRLGAGIKVKVLECMAAGLAIVTTPEGIEGIAGAEGIHFLIGRSHRELAEHVATLLSEPGRAAAMGEAARELVLKGHHFEAPLLELEQIINKTRLIKAKLGHGKGDEIIR